MFHFKFHKRAETIKNTRKKCKLSDLSMIFHTLSIANFRMILSSLFAYILKNGLLSYQASTFIDWISLSNSLFWSHRRSTYVTTGTKTVLKQRKEHDLEYDIFDPDINVIQTNKVTYQLYNASEWDIWSH